MVGTEHDVFGRRRGDPRIVVQHFVFKLARFPACMPHGQKRVGGAVAVGYVAQYVKAGGQRGCAVHRQAAIPAPVRRMKHESAPVIHRAARAQVDAAAWRYGGDAKLFKHIVQNRL